MPMRMLVALTLASALAACSDFEPAAALVHPQIIAVIAEPPVVAPGGRSELTVVVAGPDGRMAPALSWTAPIVVDGDGRAWFEAPANAATEFVTVEVAVTLADGTTLYAEKLVGVAAEPGRNPTIEAVRIDGVALDDAVALQRDALLELSADIRPPPPEDAMFSWYATVGELAYYRRVPAELATPDEPRTGDLFLVYRDGLGGVAWRQMLLSVE